MSSPGLTRKFPFRFLALVSVTGEFKASVRCISPSISWASRRVSFCPSRLVFVGIMFNPYDLRPYGSFVGG
jgi:hypothetical protein